MVLPSSNSKTKSSNKRLAIKWPRNQAMVTLISTLKEEALVLAKPLDPLEVIHLSHIFGLEEEQATKTNLKEQALIQKGVLISKFLFHLSRTKRMTTYISTGMAIMQQWDSLEKILRLGLTYSEEPFVANGQVLQLMAFDARKPKQRGMNATPPLGNIEDLFHSQDTLNRPCPIRIKLQSYEST